VGKNILKIIKIFALVILTLVIGLVFYHEMWSLEYYHLPPISFVKVESERTKLINGIESYQSIAEFKGFLSRSSFQSEESRDNQPSPKGRPPFNMHTITIKNYSHLGFSGELDIGFFNNRLNSSIFYPAEIEKYISALEKEGLKLDNNRETIRPPHTRVQIATDYKGRKYVKWSDIRLDKEVELWIKRYS
jgi:hypothetical protein